MQPAQREAHKRILKAVSITGSTIYAASPMELKALRHGSIHFISNDNDTAGGTIKVYGSNVYPVGGDGEEIMDTEREIYAATLGVPANGGVIEAADLALWVDTGLGLLIPTAPGTINTMLPIPAFESQWLLVVVAPSGSNPIVLDAYAKFKAGA